MDLVEIAGLIEKHHTVWENGEPRMKYMGYEYVPEMCYTQNLMAAALKFRSLYRVREEYQTDGSYDNGNPKVRSYINNLFRLWQEVVNPNGRVTDLTDNIDIRELISELDEIGEMAEDTIRFVSKVAKLYPLNYTYTWNQLSPKFRRESDYPNRAEIEAMRYTLAFVRDHSDPQVFKTHMELLQILGNLAARYSSTIEVAELYDCERIESNHGYVYQTDNRQTLPESFEDFAISNKLIYRDGINRLLMQSSPASKFLFSLLIETQNEPGHEQYNKAESIISENKIPLFQPRNHVQGQPLSESLAKARVEILAIIDRMTLQVDKFEESFQQQLRTRVAFQEKLESERRNGSAPFLGSESTKPTKDDGPWTDKI